MMGKNSAIEWTEHTFNPWWGCHKVSAGCDHCYAEAWAKRTGNDIWGPPHSTARRMMSDAHWQKPLAWNKEAATAGRPARVFCASMADVFEALPTLDEPRARLWTLVEATPWLTWQLLTKRAASIRSMVPSYWMEGAWPANAWIGTTAENQEQAQRRIPHLVQVPAPVRFLSCEPLLEILDLRYACFNGCDPIESLHGIDWVIVGGESGRHARPMFLGWARLLRDQCADAHVPFFFKQWGEWRPVGEMAMERVGKKIAGRLLDGMEHNGMPEVAL